MANSVKVVNKHHILVDDIAFEKFKILKILLQYKTNKRITSSVLLELTVMITAEVFEQDEDRVLQKLEEFMMKRGKKIEKKEELNVEELLKKLKE